MEERKEAKYNLYGACPGCSKQIKIELTIATELVEKETETKPEGKDNADDKRQGKTEAGGSESAGVQPDSAESAAAGETAKPKPADSKKAGGNKKTGGKAQ